MKRLFEMTFSLIILFITLPVVLLFCILIIAEDLNSPIFIQKRLGKNKKVFNLYKLRTMKVGTNNAATHEVSKSNILRIGKIARKLKIDELPQFYNVLVGDIQIVGPRPCLPNQNELIYEREKYQLFKIKPGITGISQLLNVMMDKPKLQASLDSNYFKRKSNNLYFYFYCIFSTAIKLDAKMVFLRDLCEIE